jgi:DNA gyrase/topoisomerase IV subunit B
VRELTAGRRPLHASPFVFDARWPQGRARCALQWCEGTEGRVHAFLDGTATRAEGPHVDGVLWAVRAGLAAAGHTSPDALSLERLRQGLTCVLSVESAPHALPPAPEALTAQVVECLFPAVREAFGCHPATEALLKRALTDA